MGDAPVPSSAVRRIGHCVHGLDVGGAQKVIGSIARGLTETSDGRFEIFIYSGLDGVLRPELEDTGAAVRIVPRRVPKLDPWCALGMAKWFERDRLDLVHAHLFGDSLHAFLACRLRGGLPLVLTLHNRWRTFSRLQRMGYRAMFKRCAALIACSGTVHASLLADEVESRRLLAIPNGIELPAEMDTRPLLEELGLGVDGEDRERPLVLTCLGRLDEQKGQRFLLEAAARLEQQLNRPFKLLLVGDGPDEEMLQRSIEQQGLGHVVELMGARTDVPAILGITDVFVMPSLWEGLPIALLEAMASRLCVVGTRIPGIEEGVRDGREALLVEPGSASQLGHAILRACQDDALRASLGAAAGQRWEERFSASSMVAAYSDLYDELLESPGVYGPTRAAREAPG